MAIVGLGRTYLTIQTITMIKMMIKNRDANVAMTTITHSGNDEGGAAHTTTVRTVTRLLFVYAYYIC